MNINEFKLFVEKEIESHKNNPYPKFEIEEIRAIYQKYYELLPIWLLTANSFSDVSFRKNDFNFFPDGLIYKKENLHQFKDFFLRLSESEQKINFDHAYTFYFYTQPYILEFFFSLGWDKKYINAYDSRGQTLAMNITTEKAMIHLLNNGYDLNIKKKTFSQSELDKLKIFDYTLLNEHAGLTAYEIAVIKNIKLSLKLLKPIDNHNDQKEYDNLFNLPLKKAYDEVFELLKKKNSFLFSDLDKIKPIITYQKTKKKNILFDLITLKMDDTFEFLIQQNWFDCKLVNSYKADCLMYAFFKKQPKIIDAIIKHKFYDIEISSKCFYEKFNDWSNIALENQFSKRSIQKMKELQIPFTAFEYKTYQSLKLKEKLESKLNNKDTEKRTKI